MLFFFSHFPFCILLLLQLSYLNCHHFSVYFMENLYQSLYHDLNQYNDTFNTFNFQLNIVEHFSGQYDINCLSKYYSFEE